ncbi:hypothetical protein LINPERHAP1_LOCUS27653, partial [Linum perenne]
MYFRCSGPDAIFHLVFHPRHSLAPSCSLTGYHIVEDLFTSS